jgi:uncharacterized membrane protein
MNIIEKFHEIVPAWIRIPLYGIVTTTGLIFCVIGMRMLISWLTSSFNLTFTHIYLSLSVICIASVLGLVIDLTLESKIKHKEFKEADEWGK